MDETVPSINLLPKKGVNFMTHFLNWTLSIGRLLIILTEFVALATFIYRFGLDMQIVDLHDKIKSQYIILSSFKSYEDTFRNVQSRLELIKKYDSLSTRIPTLFSDIAAAGKGKVTFNDLTVASDYAKIDANALSPAALTQFISSLKTLPLITGISVDKVENNTSKGMIHVTLTATLQKANFDTSNTESQPVNTKTVQQIEQE